MNNNCKHEKLTWSSAGVTGTANAECTVCHKLFSRAEQEEWRKDKENKKEGIKMMNAEQFAYWLQGFFELSESKNLSEKQIQVIKDHLALVFTKVTPNRQERAEEGKEQQQQPTSPEPFDWTRINDYLRKQSIPGYEPYNPHGWRFDRIYCEDISGQKIK